MQVQVQEERKEDEEGLFKAKRGRETERQRDKWQGKSQEDSLSCSRVKDSVKTVKTLFWVPEMRVFSELTHP